MICLLCYWFSGWISWNRLRNPFFCDRISMYQSHLYLEPSTWSDHSEQMPTPGVFGSYWMNQDVFMSSNLIRSSTQIIVWRLEDEQIYVSAPREQFRPRTSAWPWFWAGLSIVQCFHQRAAAAFWPSFPARFDWVVSSAAVGGPITHTHTQTHLRHDLDSWTVTELFQAGHFAVLWRPPAAVLVITAIEEENRGNTINRE